MFFLSIIALLFFGIGENAWAQEAPSVVINEIMWAKAEYIELFNAGNEPISLGGWYITRQKPAIGGVDQLEETIVPLVTFGSSDIIPTKGYFLIESTESATEIASNKIKSSLGLIDGGVLLRLRAQDKSVIDTANRTGAWFAGEVGTVGESMERLNSASDGEVKESWYTSVGNIGGRIGTPGQENSQIPTPTPTPTPVITPTPTPAPPVSYSSDVHINEFLPDPAGDDAVGEFIELYNAGSAIVDISGWMLDDIENGGSSPFTIPDDTNIASGGFYLFGRAQTKLSLNNESDHVRFIRPDAVIQDDASYSDTREGHSYNRISAGIYEKSSTITPGAVNMLTAASTPTPKPSIAVEEEKEGSISYEFSSKIVINEFLPNPIGSDTDNEFIELKSEDTKTIHLFGWVLDDAIEGSSPYHFTKEDSIAPGKIFVLFRTKTKIALNNDEDVVRLIDPDRKIISSVKYKEKIVEGQSYNRTPDGLFAWSEIPTPGKENTISIQEKVSPTPKPKAAKKSIAPKKAASVKKAISTPGAPRVLSAVSTTLPWPESKMEEGIVSRTVVATEPPVYFPRGRQGAFIFFGVTAAFMQGLSGFSNKEKIWQK